MIERQTQERIAVLLVEDEPADQERTRRAIDQIDPGIRLHIVDNGEQALTYLQSTAYTGGGADQPAPPDIVLLDINMPRMDGKQTLERIRSDGNLRHLPVIMLTSSARDEDICDCYGAGANAYVTKPLDMSGYVSALRDIEHFWLQRALLPTHCAE